MELHVQTRLIFVLLGTYMSSCLLLYECRKLTGYKFPVYSTKFCPGNQTEWNERASAINCTERNGYLCFPNENFAQLVEFCYTLPFIWIQEGFCLYLDKRSSIVNSYSCSRFQFGCHNTSFASYKLFEYPSCTSIGNGCFLAEPSCKGNSSSAATTTFPPGSKEDTHEKLILVLAIIGGIIFLGVVLCLLFVYHRRGRDFCIQNDDVDHNEDEIQSFIEQIERDKAESRVEGSQIETVMNEVSTETENNHSETKNDNNSEVKLKTEVSSKKKNEHFFLETGLNFLLHNLKNPNESWTKEKLIIHVQKMIETLFEKRKVDLLKNFCKALEEDADIRNTLLKCGEEMYQVKDSITEKYNALELTVSEGCVCLTFCFDADRDEENFLYILRKGDADLQRDISKLILNKTLMDIFGVDTQHVNWTIINVVVKKGSSCVKEEQLSKQMVGFAKDFTAMKGSPLERAIFEQWEEDNKQFVSTKACKKVEKLVKSQNLVIVTGNSGSGKSAIIQYIALRYRGQGWIVKPIYEINEITDAYSSVDELQHKALFVLNDPIGNESFDEIAYNSWKEQEKRLKVCLKTIKLLLSCRKYTLNDSRVKGILSDKSCIVDLSHDQLKLDKDEKQKIWESHSPNRNISKENIDEILQIEECFPLLCKLYFSNKNKKIERLRFFKEPFDVFKEEIRLFRKSCKEKYCALVLLVLFNNKLCVKDIRKNDQSRGKYKLALELCEMLPNTTPHTVNDALTHLEGFFVKKIGDTYHFYHDFVMEVTISVFGSDYPTELIKYADIGFLRRGVKLKSCSDKSDQLSVDLSDKYIYHLGERLQNEIFGERLLDVVLNPCLKNEKVIDIFKDILMDHPDKEQLLRVNVKLHIKKRECFQVSNNVLFSKLDFAYLENIISPLNALVLFDHTELSLYCIKAALKLKTAFTDGSLFSTVCCNGSLKLFAMFAGDDVKHFMSKKWKFLTPIHIVSVFHNHDILRLLIQAGGDVNLVIGENVYWSPLTLAAGNNTEESKENDKSISNRDITVQILLSNGAYINFCHKRGFSPLHIACQMRHDSTVQLLLTNGANINLRDKNGFSPLDKACEKGHESTVHLLLRNGADINLCDRDGVSPIEIACWEGHESIVGLLLSNGAKINLCDKNGFSPLHIAVEKRHESIVELLLRNEADINLRDSDGVSPLEIACEEGHESIVELLLNHGANINLCDKNGSSPLDIACQMGHESIVELLLRIGANISLCDKNGVYPLSIACQEGHDSIVQLLLWNGAEINSCDRDGVNPLHIACEEGHESIVELLLRNEADINICDEHGSSPLSIACQEGHDIIVKMLLRKGASINLCDEHGSSPLYKACQKKNNRIVELLLRKGANIYSCDRNGVRPLDIACKEGHDSTVKLLLRNGADINLCGKDGVSPLDIACEEGQESIVELLLRNGADINLCDEHESSPLSIACQEGHDSIVQILLRKGANLNLCDEHGSSPLYLACQKGHDCIVELLLSNGADVNLYDEHGVSPLYQASQRGHNTIVQLLLSYGADINLCNKYRASPIYIACQKGHDSSVQLLLSNGADINLCNKYGASPLYIACQKGFERTVQILLSYGADINLCDKNRPSPLQIACHWGHHNIVQLLLINGADINSCDKHGSSPFYVACRRGHESIVQLLLGKGIDVNSCNKNGASPLYKACQKGHKSTVKLLLNNGADINLCNKYGVSPLYIASQEGHDNIVQLLLNRGSDIY